MTIANTMLSDTPLSKTYSKINIPSAQIHFYLVKSTLPNTEFQFYLVKVTSAGSRLVAPDSSLQAPDSRGKGRLCGGLKASKLVKIYKSLQKSLKHTKMHAYFF